MADLDPIYYVRHRGRQSGPFDWETLNSMMRRGMLTRVHEISIDGVNWHSVGHELRPLKEVQPDPKPAAAVTAPVRNPIPISPRPDDDQSDQGGSWITTRAGVVSILFVVTVIVVTVTLIIKYSGSSSSPTEQPITTPQAETTPSVISSPPPVVQNPAAPRTSSLRDSLSENVGMLVQLARCEYEDAKGRAEVNLVLGTGTCFAISNDGKLLTNKHVIVTPPNALPKYPGLKVKDVYLLACFGANATDQFIARSLYVSPKNDVALLSIAKNFPRPLPLAVSATHQLDQVTACGFPGIVSRFVISQNTTPAAWDAFSKRAAQTGRYNELELWGPDVFKSTAETGTIAAEEREIDGARVIQLNVTISPGNSGGPILNARGEVVGIATYVLKDDPTHHYNWAIATQPLVNELRPYLEK